MLGNTYSNTYTSCTAIVDQECPICGKNFIPAPYHQWKMINRKTKGIHWVNVCSYSCMRKAEKEIEKADIEKQEKKRMEREQKKKEKKKK